MDIGELNEFISFNLRELAWRNNYPLVEEPAIRSFVYGLRVAGLEVDNSVNPMIISYDSDYKGKREVLVATISREEVLAGWRGNFKGSPRAIYNSVYETIDRLHETIRQRHPPYGYFPSDLGNELSKDRQDKGHATRKAFDDSLLTYFRRYQEGMFVELGKDSQVDPEEPQILNWLFNRKIIDLDQINFALRFCSTKEGNPFRGSNIEAVIDYCQGQYDYTSELIGRGESVPIVLTESGAEDYIWGVYLIDLAVRKNYPFVDSVNNFEPSEEYFNVLEFVVDRGWKVLKTLEVRR